MRRKIRDWSAFLGVMLCFVAVLATPGVHADDRWLYESPADRSLLMASRPDPVEQPTQFSSDEEPIESEPAESYGVQCCPPVTSRLCPCAYFWADALILGRDNQSRNRALVLDLNTDEELLGTDDLGFDWAGGLSVGYGYHICDCMSLEFAYLGVFDNSDSDGVAVDDTLMLPGDLGLAVNNFFGADTVDVNYESDLHSFEANTVCCCCCSGCCSSHSIEWLSGFRYLSFDEDLGISSFDDAEGRTLYAVDVDNNLYGGQIGSRYRRVRGRWSWESTGKVGLFLNDMQQTQSPLVDFPNFVFRAREEDHSTDLAFVGDVNMTAIYQLTHAWGARIGYNLIWLEGVALAADQLDFTNSPGSGSKLRDGGGVFFHGVNAGLEARW